MSIGFIRIRNTDQGESDVRRHAKASTAGSTQRQAKGLGRFFGGALIARALARRAGGSGAPSFGTAAGPRVASLLAVAGALCALALAATAAPAAAATVTERPLLFTFDGSGIPGGPIKNSNSIAVDDSSGAVYVAEAGVYRGEDNRIYRFHADGTPWDFSATGVPWINEARGVPLGLGPTVAVDNSGGPNEGRIYVSDRIDSKLYAFDPSGEALWAITLPEQPADVAVDAEGHPYVVPSTGGSGHSVREYANTGSPPAEIDSFPIGGTRAIDADSAGDLFLVNGEELQKWVGGVNSGTFASLGARDVAVDQSSASGHIFTVGSGRNERQLVTISATAGQFKLSFGGETTADLNFNASYLEIRAALEALPSIGAGSVSVSRWGTQKYQVSFQGVFTETDVEQLGCEDGTTPLSGGSGCVVETTTTGEPSQIREYDAGGSLLGGFGSDYLGAGRSIAYDPTLDQLYVLQNADEFGTSFAPVVAVFGSSQTGTVGEATVNAPTSVGVSEAHFSGTVNPLGTSSEWRFQWRRIGAPWDTGGSSPSQSLPADSSEHTVEFTTHGLRGGTAYQVRLVAVNTANGLAGFSGAEELQTETAAEAPAVTIAAPSAVGTTTAKISGTVNPEGDTADWRVQLSSDPACTSGFSNQSLRTIAEASSSPVGAEYELEGLLPSEHYCARISATNSAGTTTSETKQFTTGAAPPTEAEAIAPAPRLDTSARLNARINPEGEQLSYQFEYSADGGETWQSLAEQSDTSESRSQIVLGEEATGLQPETSYVFRVTVENPAGTVQSQPSSFSTRSTAEATLPTRGFELVNSPDKGNQNALAAEIEMKEPPLSADGERFLWITRGGAPGGYNATGGVFLAERSPSGWTSRSVSPPPSEQAGGGTYKYELYSRSDDMSNFTFLAGPSQVFTFVNEMAVVGLDDQQHQTTFQTYEASVTGGVDTTTDGKHVLIIDPSHQLVDIGSGTPEVVSIMPDGTESSCGLVQGFSFVGFNPSGSSLAADAQWRGGYHMIDRQDASLVYFEAKPNGECSSSTPWGLYVRDRATGETQLIDPGVSAPRKQDVEFLTATPDGQHAYFLTDSQLDPADTNHSRDVYRWDESSGESTCLTCVVSEAAVGEGIGTAGGESVLVSKDFSHIYFASTNQLVPGQGAQGSPNVYALSHGSVHFVTTTTPDLGRDAAVSTDGNVLLFRAPGSRTMTSDSLASGCSRPQAYETGLFACDELYRYEDDTRSLECVSCARGGTTTHIVGSPGTSANFDFRMSADGSTVVFATKEALLPSDVNRNTDVYEWHNGALQLITDGVSDYGENFAAPQVLGLDGNGRDAFLALLKPGLTGYERDELVNIYDARAGGGFERPSPPAHCDGESCQGPVEAAPATTPSASSSFQGNGNVRATSARKRCARHRVRRNGRCVPRQRRRRHRHGRHRRRHNGRHGKRHNGRHGKRHGRTGHTNRGGAK